MIDREATVGPVAMSKPSLALTPSISVMPVQSHTMLEDIQPFEKRDQSLTVADLVPYFGVESNPIQD